MEEKEITINDFTGNEKTGQTANEVYQEYLNNKNNPPKQKIQPTQTEILQKQLLETQNLVLELQEQILLNKQIK